MRIQKLKERLNEILESLQGYIRANPDGSIGEHPNITFLRTENMIIKLIEEIDKNEDTET